MEDQQISSVTPRKYFITAPNLYDDSGLDVYEFRLLIHYVRVGNCWEKTQTTADKCKMGKAQVIAKRTSLQEKGLITAKIHPQHSTWDIHVVDKWQENMARYRGNESDTPTFDTPPITDSLPKEDSIKKNKDNGNIFKEWEKVRGTLTPFEADELIALEGEWETHRGKLNIEHPNYTFGTSSKVIVAAIIATGRSADRPSINYLDAVLKSWMQKGIGNKPKKNSKDTYDKEMQEAGYDL